jgi:hypothetical protein
MPNILIGKAVGALAKSVASIVNCDESDATKREALGETFSQFEAYMAKSLDGEESADRGGASDHHASKVADLLVEAGSHPNRSTALSYLMHSPHGAALLSRLHKATGKESPMSSLQDIAKTHGVAGVVQIAKNITEEQRSFRITEEEFVKLIDTAARVAHPELGARAFEKVYERNPLLARAIAVIKAGLAEQLLSGSQHAKSDRGSAYGDLMEKAEAYRNAHPELSVAQCFEKIYTDRANVELAKRERVESRPR